MVKEEGLRSGGRVKGSEKLAGLMGSKSGKG